MRGLVLTDAWCAEAWYALRRCVAAVFDAAQKRRGVKVHEYTVMMHAYLLNNLREEAEDLFVSLHLPRACISALQLCLSFPLSPLLSSRSSLQSTNGWTRAQVEMREAGIRPTAVTYATMIDGLAAAGDALTALQLFWEAHAQGLFPFSTFITRQDDDSLLVRCPSPAGRVAGCVCMFTTLCW